jgi:N-acetyl-anhydromuramyl-L-alanine amidase AmpD
MEPLNLSEIVQVDFSPTQYYREETSKNQVVLHHTVSGKYAQGVIDWWNTDPQRIATHFVIQNDGTIFQLYSSKYWAHHLGVKADFLKKLGFADYGNRNTKLNQNSVAMEICNWGGLVKADDGTFHPAKWDTTLKKYVPVMKIIIPEEQVQIYPKPFRDFLYFEKYSPAQIESISKLVVYLCNKFGIDKTYQPDMWDVSMNALSGESHIYSHVSYRNDKSDLHPQPEMIQMLQSLT